MLLFIGGITARFGDILHEHLSAKEIRCRFPQFAISSDMEAVFEQGAYSILAEESRLQMLNEAVQNGAHLMYGMRVSKLISEHGNPIIKTINGETISAGSVVVCAGAWAGDMFPELKSMTKPYWVPIHWFQPRRGYAAAFHKTTLPVFLYEEKNGALIYGIPAGLSSEKGVKIGFHNRQHVEWQSNENPPDIQYYANEIKGSIENVFPDLEPYPLDSKWCIYNMCKDESFIIDQFQQGSNVFFASACSGHGFKFAPAVGKVMSELGLGMPLSVDIAQFSASRFGSGS